MLKKAIVCTVLFLVVVGAHGAWIASRPACAEGGCCEGPPEPVGVAGYLEAQDYFLGLSYGLSGAFALYALWSFVEGRKAAAAAAAGSLSMAGILSAFGCFLTGCCGSPMLAVYASFLGGTFLGFVKPLAFGVTLLSVAFGFAWLARRGKRAQAACSCGNACRGN